MAKPLVGKQEKIEVPPNHCFVLLPFKSSLLRNSYFIFFPLLVCEEKGVRDPSQSSQTTETARKRNIPFQQKKNRCACFPLNLEKDYIGISIGENNSSDFCLFSNYSLYSNSSDQIITWHTQPPGTHSADTKSLVSQ